MSSKKASDKEAKLITSIRELHSTQCMTVQEIADKLGIPDTVVIDKLIGVHCKPRFKKEQPEPNPFIVEMNKKKAEEQKKEEKAMGKPVTSQEKIDEILRLRIECGMSIGQITNKTGIPTSTVARYVRGIPAGGPKINDVDEWDSDDMPPVEVTGDTDIEAYNKAWEDYKKEKMSLQWRQPLQARKI